MLKTGEVLFDKYRIDGHIENGKNGSTFRAYDLKKRGKVSITTLDVKNFSQDIDSARKLQNQLQQEIDLSTRLDSPYILKVYRSILSADTLYIFSEYIPGFNLSDQILSMRTAGKRLPINHVQRIGIQIAAGLNDLHQRGIIHMNLNPKNLFITVKGEIKISGIGSALASKARFQVIVEGNAPVYTPETADYLPPEWRANTNLLPRPNIDIYAAGCVIFELMSGIKYSHVTPETRISALRNETPKWMDELVSRMVSMTPSERPWDGSELYIQFQQRKSHLKFEKTGQINWLAGEARALASLHKWQEVEVVLSELTSLGEEGLLTANRLRKSFGMLTEAEINSQTIELGPSRDQAVQTDNTEPKTDQLLDIIGDFDTFKPRPRLSVIGIGLVTLCLFSMVFLYIINQGVNYFFVSSALASFEEIEEEELAQQDDGEPILELTIEENTTPGLTIGRSAEPVWLDPAVTNSTESNLMGKMCVEGLYTRQPGDYPPLPALASGCASNESGTEWTCSLFENIQFHDGTPFNADAVVYNFERWKTSNHPQHFEGQEFEAYKDHWGGFDEESRLLAVEKLNDLTVKFVLEQPDEDFLDTLALESFSISSPSALEKFGWDYGGQAAGCVGTGPLKFKDWDQDDLITFSAFESYRFGLPQIDLIVWKPYPESSLRFQALKDGAVDIILETDNQILSEAEQNPELQVVHPVHNAPMIVSNSALGMVSNILGYDLYYEEDLSE